MFIGDKVREISKELTLLLMYFNRFTNNRRSYTDIGFYAWKDMILIP